MSHNDYTYNLLLVISKVNDDSLQSVCESFDEKSTGVKFGDIGFGNGAKVMIDCESSMTFEQMLEIEPRFVEFIDDDQQLDLDQHDASEITSKWKFT